MNNTTLQFSKHFWATALLVAFFLSAGQHALAQEAHRLEFEIKQPEVASDNDQDPSDEEERKNELIKAYRIAVAGASQEKNATLLNIENIDDQIDMNLVSNFWIGVQCEKAQSTSFAPKVSPETELTIKGGMKVLAVSEGGAANEAGLEEDDVLLKFAGKELNSINDLYAAIGETEDNETEIVLIRDSELVSLQITPKKRPEESDEEDSAHEIKMWTTIEEAYNNELDGKQIPKGYRVEMEMVRGKEILFQVTQDDNTWQATEETIDELPESIQPIAEELFQRCKPLVGANPTPVWKILHNPLQPIPFQDPSSDRLESIERQLNELTEAIKQLKNEKDN